jgi:arylsulfotransferase ASST
VRLRPRTRCFSRGRRRLAGIALLALAGALAAITALAASDDTIATAQPPAVAAFPIPGSKLATPWTQITFRGVPASALGTIQVTGSSSGVHAGTIEADSDGNGGSFVPQVAFQPGETVTVTTLLNVLGANQGTYQFTVATPAGGVPYARALIVPRAPGDVWRFRSRQDLAPPAVKILSRSASPGGDDIFVAPQYGPVQNGLEIVDESGRLIWFDRVTPGDTASDFRVQTYKGNPVLTWWEGFTDAGVGVGQDVIFNSAYQEIATVNAGNGLHADLHEFELTPSGTALVTAYFPVYWDASSIHGSAKEIVLDSVVQEIDIPTGLVLFQWDSLDHVPVGDSHAPLPVQTGKQRNPFDYFHVNSIALDDDGNLVVSARNTWAAYKIDRQTGAVLWTLGGKRSSFKMGPGTMFAFQHDVRIQAQRDQFVTLFDDGAGPPNVHSQSRAVELSLNFKQMTATLASQHQHSPALLADFEGNVEQLPGFDDFVGWGQQPYFTEYDRHGHLVLDGRFVGTTSSYRSYAFSWSATPAVLPAVAASTSGKTTSVYASWNGATGVAAWRVLSGASASALRPTRTVTDTNFETGTTIVAAAYVAVQALDVHGHLLATSPIVRST